MIERAGVGGQAGVTERLDNFPGFPEGISGAEFADRLRQQAERFGVEILTAQEVASVAVDGDYRVVRTNDGVEYRSWAVLLALGSTYQRLGVTGEEDFIGAGVHFCATCDGAFYRNRDVVVIGGGNSAGEESIFLTKFASRVTIVTRDTMLSASKVVVEKVEEDPKIDVITNASPVEFRGDGKLETVVLKDRTTEALSELHPAGVFVFIGLTPNTADRERPRRLRPVRLHRDRRGDADERAGRVLLRGTAGKAARSRPRRRRARGRPRRWRFGDTSSRLRAACRGMRRWWRRRADPAEAQRRIEDVT